jgi:putative transposase
MIYPLVRELAAEKIPVAVTCRVLGFSKQAFYAWNANPIPQRDWDDAHLINAAIDIHHDDPAFGYRFIADELRERGIAAGENRVARLCSQQRLWSIFARKRDLNRKVGPPVHDDLVDRRFTAPAANAVWLTDITEHPTTEGKLYLCAIKDVHSGRIVGYSMDARMTASLAVTALRNAIALRTPAGTIVHSDRGSQGGFKWSSQHLERGGARGQTGWVDEGVDGKVGNEVAGSPVAAPGRGASVLAWDRQGSHERGGRNLGRCVAGGRFPLVPGAWRDAFAHPCAGVR